VRTGEGEPTLLDQGSGDGDLVHVESGEVVVQQLPQHRLVAAVLQLLLDRGEVREIPQPGVADVEHEEPPAVQPRRYYPPVIAGGEGGE